MYDAVLSQFLNKTGKSMALHVSGHRVKQGADSPKFAGDEMGCSGSLPTKPEIS